MPNINMENLTCRHACDNLSLSFIEKVRDCFFYQHITEVTRFRGENIGNILDLIFMDDELLVEGIKIDCPLGKVTTVLCNSQKEEYAKYAYLYDNAGCSKLGKLLSINWKEYLNYQDVDVVWGKFKKKFQEAIDVCVPKRKFISGERLRKKNRDLVMNRKLY